MRQTNNIACKQASLAMFSHHKKWILKNTSQRSSEAIIKNLTNFDLAAHLFTYSKWLLPTSTSFAYVESHIPKGKSALASKIIKVLTRMVNIFL